MEMENLGRSFDRSRELGLKRARLEEHIVSRNSNGGREIEGGSDTASIQELASRYRTALAELTFNSKPIITNLTIIAGESLHAAKAIASIICSNILEVPTEQKLPSLYLLDSIVKNIGRDYIKYFASRLPDVFCKAYRQVDPAVHPGMRHLFGTWRNVFPPQALQMIEKELGFPPAVNISASGTSKPGSQSQRPAQSIHVNPKYLEARQHQQSSKVKGTIADINMSQGNLRDDTEKSERTNLQSARQRADPRLKMHSIQHPPKDVGLASFQQDSSEFGAYDYDPELARHSTAGKTGGRVTEQVLDRAWYESGSNITETTSSQRNGADIKLGPTNYLASRSANSDANLQNVHHIVSGRSSIGMDKSWKNSEEEEYTWDDMNSRSTTHGVIRKSKRDPRLMDDSERLKNQMTLGSRAPSVGHHSALGLGYPASAQISSGNSEGHPATLTGLSANSNSLVRTSYPLPNNLTFATSAVPDSSGSILQQRYSVEVASPSGQSPMQQRPSQSDTLPRIDVRTTQISGKSNFEMHSQFPQNFPVPDQKVPQIVHRGSVQNLQSIHSQGSSHINSSSQQRHHIPSLQKLQSDPIQYNSSALSHKPVLPQVSIVGNPSTVEKSSSGPSKHSSPEMVGQMSTSSLLTAVMDSGILGKKAVTGSIPKDSYQNAIALPSQASSRPPIPSGASPTQSGVKVASAIPLSLQSHKSTLVSSAQRQTEQLPLPRPHSSVVGSALEQTANVVNIASNPMSSLLNTLVAKGLISASRKESTDPPQIIDDLQNQILGTATSTTLSVLSAVSPSSMGEQLSLSNPTAKNDDTLHASSLNDIKSHVGFEFKPDVIRVSHPAVINELHDLPHRCSVCSLQVKLKEHLDRHMEWHTLKAKYSSRRWYDSYLDYIKGKDSTHEATVLKVVSDNKLESGDELMVPADESHCVCVLCGELFEDFYNKKVDQWMFKEAVYLPLSARGVFTSLTGEKGPIVHANCISDSSLRDLGLAKDVKAEKERA